MTRGTDAAQSAALSEGASTRRGASSAGKDLKRAAENAVRAAKETSRDGPPAEQDSKPENTPEAVAASISREVVQALKLNLGRGPTKAKTHIHDDCVVVLLREGHLPSEQLLAHAGRHREVAQGRVDISEAVRGPLTQIVEKRIERRVVGFMSSSQHDPDLISYVFVLESLPLLDSVFEDKGP